MSTVLKILALMLSKASSAVSATASHLISSKCTSDIRAQVQSKTLNYDCVMFLGIHKGKQCEWAPSLSFSSLFRVCVCVS